MAFPSGYQGWYSWMSNTTFGITSYSANHQVFGNPANVPGDVWDGWNQAKNSRPLTIQGISDGSSNTSLFAEHFASCPLSWMPGGRSSTGWANLTFEYPNAAIYNASYGTPQFGANPANCDPTRLHAMSAAGTMVGMADGSVRSVSTGVSALTWANVGNPQDGNVLGSDW